MKEYVRQYVRKATSLDMNTLFGIMRMPIFIPFEVKAKRAFIIGMRMCKCGCGAQLPGDEMVFIKEGGEGSKERAYAADCAKRTLAWRALKSKSTSSAP